MIVLDTNVVSELMRKDAAAEVVAWVDQYDLALSTRNIKDFANTGIRVLNPWS